MNLYVIGPVTGIPNGNRPAFEDAQRVLNDAGYSADIPHAHISEDARWEEAMKVSIARMLLSDGVAMVEGWEESRGARLEHELACALKIPARPVPQWAGM